MGKILNILVYFFPYNYAIQFNAIQHITAPNREHHSRVNYT